MAAEQQDEDAPYVWRVAFGEDGDFHIDFGDRLSDAPHSDEAKLHVVGKALIALGTKITGNRWVEQDDDEFDDDDYDDH